MVPLLLPLTVQLAGSRDTSSLAVAQRYPVNLCCAANVNMKFVTFPFDTKFKSSAFVAKLLSTRFGGVLLNSSYGKTSDVLKIVRVISGETFVIEPFDQFLGNVSWSK